MLKKINNQTIILMLYIGIIGVSLSILILNDNHHQKIIYEVRYVIIEPEEKSDWDIFIDALICVESRGNDTIVGQTNDVGCLQITPIYVAEVNRLLGEEKYFLEDRTSREKSLEMFNIIQKHYNPEFDINKAIKLHNPGASENYHNKIIIKYNELRNEK